MTQPSDRVPVDFVPRASGGYRVVARAEAGTPEYTRAKLAELIGYEPGEHDAEFDKALAAYRAAVLREAADALNERGKPTCEPDGDCCWYDAVAELRRMAVEETR